MAPWKTDPALAARSDLAADFTRTWQAADKVVYSSTLSTASTTATRVEREFDPEAVRQLKTTAVADNQIEGVSRPDVSTLSG